MILTRKTLRAWNENARLFLTRDEEAELLYALGKEPDEWNTYTEQDLYEQARKILQFYRAVKRLEREEGAR